MEYEIIQPPFTLEFRTMSRKEANDYFDWFMEQIPIRVRLLERAVRSTAGYEDWRADYTPDSLRGLGQWFHEHVRTRERTREEKETIYRKAPEWFRSVEIADWELTNQTFSLAIDIGMYFGRVLEKQLRELKWVMVKKPKNHVDFQQPVLTGTGKLDLNPVRILVNCAYGMARGSERPECLRELYDIWADLLVE